MTCTWFSVSLGQLPASRTDWFYHLRYSRGLRWGCGPWPVTTVTILKNNKSKNPNALKYEAKNRAISNQLLLKQANCVGFLLQRVPGFYCEVWREQSHLNVMSVLASLWASLYQQLQVWSSPKLAEAKPCLVILSYHDLFSEGHIVYRKS